MHTVKAPKNSHKNIMLRVCCTSASSYELSTSSEVSHVPSLIHPLSSIPGHFYSLQHFVPALRVAAMPGTAVSRRVGVGSDRYTAASSTGIAPFAILCLPGRGLLANGRIAFVPSCWSRNLRHSSSVATYPSSSAKNLCRSTALIRSRARLVNQPSRSWKSTVNTL